MATSAKRKYSKNIGTTPVAVGGYVAPAVTTGVYVTGLTVCNNLGAPVNVTVDVYDGVAHANLCFNTSIPVGGSINLANENNRVVLNVNDQVFVTSGSASSVDAIMSVSEIQ